MRIPGLFGERLLPRLDQTCLIKRRPGRYGACSQGVRCVLDVPSVIGRHVR